MNNTSSIAISSMYVSKLWEIQKKDILDLMTPFIMSVLSDEYNIGDAIDEIFIVEMLEILELDNSRHAYLAQIEWNNAMNLVYSRGIRQEKAVSDMFSVEGI